MRKPLLAIDEAYEIRLRAERRVGEMMEAGKEERAAEVINAANAAVCDLVGPKPEHAC
jgi:hypothetical protein